MRLKQTASILVATALIAGCNAPNKTAEQTSTINIDGQYTARQLLTFCNNNAWPLYEQIYNSPELQSRLQQSTVKLIYPGTEPNTILLSSGVYANSSIYTIQHAVHSQIPRIQIFPNTENQSDITYNSIPPVSTINNNAVQPIVSFPIFTESVPSMPISQTAVKPYECLFVLAPTLNSIIPIVAKDVDYQNSIATGVSSTTLPICETSSGSAVVRVNPESLEPEMVGIVLSTISRTEEGLHLSNPYSSIAGANVSCSAGFQFTLFPQEN